LKSKEAGMVEAMDEQAAGAAPAAGLPPAGETAVEFLSRRWRLFVILFWVGVSAYLIFERWNAIRGFMLGDTDDNMRIMQVRALLDGQGWYDLRQHRLNPPVGADIHWSRLVDLPIAALKLVFAPFLGGRIAEQVAVAVAPLLPMLVTMLALSRTVRQLVSEYAYPLALVLTVCGASAMGMWSPLRIDHHGWQLATLAVTLMALSDERRARGGLVLGGAAAFSLVIGMEMLPYLAMAGAAVVLRWVWDKHEDLRLATYGAALAGGCAIGYLVFASNANRAPLCDALTPVWLSAMVFAGAIAVLLARLNVERRNVRLALALAGGVVLAAAFALTWPDCLGRLERSTPELDRLWLSKVREAMPIYRHGARVAAVVVTLPVFGIIGYVLVLWRSRRDAVRLGQWGSIAAPAILAAALLLWQTRAGPAAQVLAIPGAAALAWFTLAWVMGLSSMLVRVVGAVVAVIAVSGMATLFTVSLFPEPLNAYRRTVNIANNLCPTLGALHPVAMQPRGLVLTFVDLGPRLITVTHHDAIAGPYHRNAQQIEDVMHAWRGSVERAHAIVSHYRVNYVLICPHMSESTIYRAETPAGFYSQLADGHVPAWLRPVPLPAGSPYRMWRVVS
jgi:hypothetical protein